MRWSNLIQFLCKYQRQGVDIPSIGFSVRSAFLVEKPSWHTTKMIDFQIPNVVALETIRLHFDWFT